MRAAAIFGPGNVRNQFARFESIGHVEWMLGVPDRSQRADAITIFGGDGTVHRHLSALVNLHLPVLVVPCGSGNDFARSLGFRKPKDSLAAWQRFAENGKNVRAIDLGTISNPIAREASNRHYFCCVAGVGLDSEIALRANNLPRWIRSHGGYGLLAPREFFRFAPFPMRVSYDGEKKGAHKPTLLAAVANAPTYGGGMKIAPHAQLDDGKLDLCVVRDMNVFKLFCLFPTVYFGRHLGFREVEYEQTQRARVETEYPFDVYADGELVCQTPVEFGLAPKALKVIVPSRRNEQ
jgi:diacylglycerol kinase (ATP)